MYQNLLWFIFEIMSVAQQFLASVDLFALHAPLIKKKLGK